MPHGRLLSFCASGILASSAFAGLGPENTAVIVNGDSWVSMTVANEYAKLRGVPASNFVVLHGLSSYEVTDVDHFRTEILGPVLAALDARGLRQQIDCVAYCPDIPYAAVTSPDMAGKQYPQVMTPVASTNGLTYLYELVEKKDTDYLNLDVNLYDRRQVPLPTGVPLNKDEQAAYAKGVNLYMEKKYNESSDTLLPLLAVKRRDSNIAYNTACSLSLASRPDEAVAALRKAVAAGWRDYNHAASDPDLKPLANREDFQQVMRLLKSVHIEVQPGAAFRSRYGWSDEGTAGTSGAHYLLSTFLGVTCGRGNSVNEVLECLRRDASADFSAPKGTIYFPKNGDVRSTTREWGFQPAVDALKALGVNAIVENGVLPMNRNDVAGAMIGTSDFNWSSSGSTVVAGAILEHLTSFGGIITERAGQTPCTDFIRAGAAGSSGTVMEPFALQEKFPTPFMHVQYAKGFTLAESFYQSVYGPYQLLVIGDPLCRPWGKPLEVSVSGVTPGALLKGKVTLKPTASRPLDVAQYELYVDGKFMSTGTSLPLDTTMLADGSHDLEIVAVEKGSLEARSHVVVPFVSGAQRVTVSQPNTATMGESASVTVACPGAKSIELVSLGQSVGQIAADKGTIDVDTSRLGLGQALLMPVAHVGDRTVTGPPVRLQVNPRAFIAPVQPPTGPTQPGLALTIAGGGSTVVQDTINGNWLQNLAKGPNQTFVLTGYFDAPKDDLYQLQLKTNTKATIEISGSTVCAARDESQRFVCVPLGKGPHRLTVHGTAPAEAVLDIRLGSNGCYHLAQGQFRCAVH